MENVKEQIDASGYADQLSAGIIITGGASQLRELPELLHQKTGLEVKRGTLQKNISFANRTEAGNPAYSQAIGLLLLGEENCMTKKVSVTETESEVVTPPVQKEKPKKTPKPPKDPDGPSWWKNLKNKAEQLFDENDAKLS